MSDVPGARARLEALLERLRDPAAPITRGAIAEEIDALLPMLTRAPQLRRGRVKGKAVTAENREAVKRALLLRPNAHLAEIGRDFGLNSGRVSEILHGKWDHL